MLEIKETILEAYTGTKKLRSALATNATDEYFAALGAHSSPSQAQLDIARTAAQSLLKKELLSPTSISAVSGETVSDERSTATIALTFDSVAKPLRIADKREWQAAIQENQETFRIACQRIRNGEAKGGRGKRKLTPRR